MVWNLHLYSGSGGPSAIICTAWLSSSSYATWTDLEKGRLLPDSGLTWKMYDQFHVSPAFILKDAKGLWNELNYVLDLLDDSDRTIILRTLENEHKLLRK